MKRPVPRASYAIFALLAVFAGCGTTKAHLATEQLLLSDAIDQAVAQIDFRPLSGKSVYFDTQYVKNVKGLAFTNAEYIISSLRQQMMAADCRLQNQEEDADYIIEARVGTIGMDGNEIVYGIPKSTGITSAAALMPNVPAIPTLPEISVARKQSELAAAKIALFAYHRESRRPVWQSGISRSKSTAQDMWLFGAGPFQRGTIYDGTQFAGQKIRLPLGANANRDKAPTVSYHKEHLFEMEDEETLVASRSAVEIPLPKLQDEKMRESFTEEWISPLQPRIVTSLESRLDWR